MGGPERSIQGVWGILESGVQGPSALSAPATCPGHNTPGPWCCCHLRGEECDQVTPPALPCFTQRVPARVKGGDQARTGSQSGRWCSGPVLPMGKSVLPEGSNSPIPAVCPSPPAVRPKDALAPAPLRTGALLPHFLLVIPLALASESTLDSVSCNLRIRVTRSPHLPGRVPESSASGGSSLHIMGDRASPRNLGTSMPSEASRAPGGSPDGRPP